MMLRNTGSTPLVAALFVGLLTVAGGCVNDSTGTSGPPSVNLTVDKTVGVAVADTFYFSFEAKGGFLGDLVLDSHHVLPAFWITALSPRNPTHEFVYNLTISTCHRPPPFPCSLLCCF